MFQQHLAKLTSYYHRCGSFGMVIDMRQAAQMPAGQRRLLAEYIDHNREQYPKVNCASAVIVANGMQRAILHVLSWLTKESAPLRPFSTVEEGLAWIFVWLKTAS